MWMQHDLDRGHLTRDQKRYFDEEAVCRCARCEDAGARNGRKLRSMVEQDGQVVHKIEAVHCDLEIRQPIKRSKDIFLLRTR